MKRMLKNLLLERLMDDEDVPAASSFDDLLVKELRDPTVAEAAPVGASDIAPSGGLSVDTTPEVMVDSTAQENDLLRAELLPRNRVAAADDFGQRPVFNETGRLTPETMFEQPPMLAAPIQSQAQVPAAPQAPSPPPGAVAPAPPPWSAPDYQAAPNQSREPDPRVARARRSAASAQMLTYDESQQPADTEPPVNLAQPISSAKPSDSIPSSAQTQAAAVPVMNPQQRQRQNGGHTDFWFRFDEARAAANLFSVPSAAVNLVIGPLEVAIGVAKRCCSQHQVGECDVYVLTERAEVPGQPDWQILRRPSDVVQVLESGDGVYPLIVLDIERELPAWVRPLVARLRQGGVGLVHYVLDDEPSDEDLATWFGELGRPSVLDLAAYVPPQRLTALLERGEPVASVAGRPISTDLLLALRLGAE